MKNFLSPANAALIAACIASSICLSSCSPPTQLTTAEDLVASPATPELFYPFHRDPIEGKPCLKADDWKNRLPLEKRDKNCTVVADELKVLTSGRVEGPLKFNFAHRHFDSGSDQDYNFPQVTDNNTELGPVSTGFLFLYYKYEGKIVFAGDTNLAFYGQAMTDPMPIKNGEKGLPEIMFKPALPVNDAVGMKWWIKKDLPFKEFKAQYPILDVDGTNVTFIQCPGGPAGVGGIGMEGKRQYIWFYAGACNRITQSKFFKVSFPEGKPPEMVELKPEDLSKEVKSWYFAEV